MATPKGSKFTCRGLPGDGADYDGMAPADQTLVTTVAVNATKAMAAYLRQLRCGPGRFDSWLDGDATALSRAEQRGAAVFVGRGACVSCHSGPRLTDGAFLESQWPEVTLGQPPTPYQRGAWESLMENGRVMRYSKDGLLQEERNYREGRLDGDQKLFFASGKLAVEQTYKNDEVRMMKCYDPSGKLELSEEYFEDGSLKSGSTEMSEKERKSKGICRLDR